MATILGSKLTKSDYSSLLVALAFLNGLQYRHSNNLNVRDLAALCINLVNYDPVTLKYKRVVGVHFFIKNNL